MPGRDPSTTDPLAPAPKPALLASRLIACIETLVLIPFGVVSGLSGIALTLTGIGPLIELCLSRRDGGVLFRESLLRHHPEMSLLEIPAHINKASGGRPYKVMVRVTKPPKPPDPPLPPVIMPGGLASNLTTMSRHQDGMTSKYGFTVAQFDRLGVGTSDPYPPGADRPPSAADVAREMDYVMRHCGAAEAAGAGPDGGWIAVGGSMGANVATAFAALFPRRLCGLLNLDGLPHAFLRIQCKKFLKDGKIFMNTLRRLRWTGLPRFFFNMFLRGPPTKAMGDAFTPTQIVGLMCQDQFFVATGLEYTTLMSCCDLECAAWGKQATTKYDAETLRIMASLAPDESIVVDQVAGVARTRTDERSASELGDDYLSLSDPTLQEFEARFRALALTTPEEVERMTTHCSWPDPPRHPVGDLVGGVDLNQTVQPLAVEFSGMAVRVMCARSYKGLERDYTQEGRIHAAARTSLHVMMAGDGGAYYYPHLTHLNLWQQIDEVVNIAHEIALAVRQLQRKEGSAKTNTCN